MPDRTILAIGGGVLAIVVIAVIVVLAAGEPDVAEYPADTPEATVQRYLAAAYDGDDETARTLLSTRVIDQMGSNPGSNLFCQPSDGHQVRIDDVDTSDQRSTITLVVENISGSGLGFDRYRYDRSVVLVFEDGGWKIDEPYFCV